RKEEYGDLINSNLEKAFRLFWVDRLSCANKLRNCVEAFLNAVGVDSKSNLHSRILEYQKKSEDGAEFLMSVKWVGNEGSHNSGAISDDDLFHCVDVLEHVFDEAFLKKAEKLKARSKQINAKYKKS
ncbi:MAG: DUF4145 domain-containing protein, partial [Pseudomonadota bacterium]